MENLWDTGLGFQMYLIEVLIVDDTPFWWKKQQEKNLLREKKGSHKKHIVRIAKGKAGKG